MSTVNPSSISSLDSDLSDQETEYQAQFAPRTHKFETINFRTPSTHQHLVDGPSLNHPHAAALFLTILVLGPLAALSAFLVDQLVRFSTLLVYLLTVQHARFWRALLVYLSTSATMAALATLLVVTISPGASGSGLPEIKAHLNGIHIPGFLRFKTLIVKLVGVGLASGAGLIIGRLGPMSHIGAILSSGLGLGAGRMFRLRLGKKHSLWRNFRTEEWKRDFVAVGGGLGIAVAFGSPMGAWIWIYEEACTHWNWVIGIVSLGGCVSGVLVVSLLNFFAFSHTFSLPSNPLGPEERNSFGSITGLGLTGFGKASSRLTDSSISYPLKDFPGYILLGILGGVLGALLPWISRFITRWRYSKVVSKGRRCFEVVFLTLATAGFKFALPWIVGKCTSIPSDFVSSLAPRQELNFSRYFCKDLEGDSYSSWAALLFNPGNAVVRALLYTSGSSTFSVPLLAVAFLFYFALSVVTLGVAVPAGIFFPGFLVGAVLGRLVGAIVGAIFRSRSDLSVEGYAFLGAVAALGGITRTISVAVIALEGTGSFDASYAAATVVLIAKLVGDFLFDKGIFDLHIALKGIPYLAEKIPHEREYQSVRVRDIASNHVIGVRRRSTIRELVGVLDCYSHNAFPVFLKTQGPLPEKHLSDSPALERIVRVSRHSSTAFSGVVSPHRRDPTHGHHLDGGGRGNQLSTSSGGLPIASQAIDALAEELVKETIGALNALGPDDEEVRLGEVRNAAASALELYKSPSRSGAFHFTILEDGIPREWSLGDHSGYSEKLPYFSLAGIIDRHTLLALLEAAADRESYDGTSITRPATNLDFTGELMKISSTMLDAAWPNTNRLKNEDTLLEGVRRARIDQVIVDLKHYLDPNPLLISDRAISAEAYRLFRATGARHILAINLRRGSISGIITRKDILPEFIVEVSQKLKGR